jgi:hypothetical protein
LPYTGIIDAQTVRDKWKNTRNLGFSGNRGIVMIGTIFSLFFLWLIWRDDIRKLRERK